MHPSSKRVSFLLIILFSCYATQAQTIYKARYHLDFKPFENNQYIGREKGLLFIQNGKSMYATENIFKQDSISRLVEAGQLSAEEVMNKNFPKSLFKESILKSDDPAKGIQTFASYGSQLFTYEQAADFGWVILPDTSTLAGYLCTKATGRFGGRNYEAWFAPELPFSDGQYKFKGLPGLIVQIGDTEGIYNFKLVSIEKTNSFPKKLFESRKEIPVSFEQLKPIARDYRENPLKTRAKYDNSGSLNTNFNLPANYPKYNFIEKL